MNLHVYSVGCSWHGPIKNVGKTEDLPVTEIFAPESKLKIGELGGKGSGLPCCPFCGSMLFQEDTNKWWEGAKQWDKEHPNYFRFLQWTEKQKRCWRNNSEAAVYYNNSPENKDFQYTHLV